MGKSSEYYYCCPYRYNNLNSYHFPYGCSVQKPDGTDIYDIRRLTKKRIKTLKWKKQGGIH